MVAITLVAAVVMTVAVVTTVVDIAAAVIAIVVVMVAAVVAIVVVMMAVVVVIAETIKFRYASAHYPPDNLATKFSPLGQLHPYYYLWGAILLVENHHQFG